jgi:hypothetical protein
VHTEYLIEASAVKRRELARKTEKASRRTPFFEKTVNF